MFLLLENSHCSSVAVKTWRSLTELSWVPLVHSRLALRWLLDSRVTCLSSLTRVGWHPVSEALSREADDFPSHQVLISLFLAVFSSASLHPLTFYYQQQRKIQLYLLCMAGKVPQLHIHVYYLQVLLSTQLDLIQPRVCTLYPGPSSSGLQEPVPHLRQRPRRCTWTFLFLQHYFPRTHGFLDNSFL